MISTANRFHGYSSINSVYRHGKTIRGNQCAIKFLPTNRNSHRVAVVVSKKVSKLAVVRNRIRRRIYEVIRINEPNIKTPHDIVFTVFNEQILDLPPKQLKSVIEDHLRDAKII